MAAPLLSFQSLAHRPVLDQAGHGSGVQESRQAVAVVSCCRLPALLKCKGRAGWDAVRDNLLVTLKQLDAEAQVGCLLILPDEAAFSGSTGRLDLGYRRASSSNAETY